MAADQTSAPNLEDYLKQLGYESVELEHNDHHQPFVEGVLGNHKRRLLVDTGTGMSTLGESAARGLKRVGEMSGVLQDRVLGTITNEAFAVVDKLVLGRAQFFNQPMRVQQFRADYVTVPFEGILGCDFLVRNYGLIDCWKHRLYVRGSRISEEQAKTFDESLRLSGFTGIPLESSNFMSVETLINGGSARLLVDTGAPFDELDDSQLEPFGLTIVRYDRAATGSYIRQDVTSSVIGLGEVGKHPLHVTKLGSFQIGPRTWKNLYFGVADLKAWGMAKPGTPAENIKGFLSPAFLGAHGALVDVWRRELWLRPEKPSR